MPIMGMDDLTVVFGADSVELPPGNHEHAAVYRMNRYIFQY